MHDPVLKENRTNLLIVTQSFKIKDILFLILISPRAPFFYSDKV